MARPARVEEEDVGSGSPRTAAAPRRPGGEDPDGREAQVDAAVAFRHAIQGHTGPRPRLGDEQAVILATVGRFLLNLKGAA